jgi:hypothetical protein
MREKRDDSIDELRIGKMMKEFGFKPESSTSTARALILNLVRSAYGPDAAREFMRQMNLEKNRGVEAYAVMEEFNREQNAQREIPGVGTEETQLSLFDSPESQKKSRQA